MRRLLLTFYGDDFTGSADAMEALALNGVRCLLFLSPPTPELLCEKFPEVEAIGVAGASRTMNAPQMESELTKIFTQIAALNARIFHYKICSTFDSSPKIGSIGKAIDIGQQIFHSPFVPLLVGAPVLKRYCLFGNLFASVGAETFRLDRHPMMRRHPVTPMQESDLRLHLAQQTAKKIALFDLFNLTGTSEAVAQNFQQLLASDAAIILFDVLDEARLQTAGKLIWQSCDEQILFTVGSSGIEYALAAHWQKAETRAAYSSAGAAEQIIVISGSCSTATKTQIEWACANNFTSIEIEAAKLVSYDQAASERERIKQTALRALNSGHSIVIYSALGPDDPNITTTDESSVTQMRVRLGVQQGLILNDLLVSSNIRRVCVAGGDTSSHVIRQLGIYALELVATMAPGSPLCRAHSHEPTLDGLEIAMKGGQHGRADYFGCVLRGVYE